ncbi:Uncharacterized protein TCM_006959 [Theobroma cacao]|uniref:TF-B3 domain-containing protein n=1 Tax=Theobroma cacao TaxID=3641 RepID=A0A061DZD0_THECC|nr:Uncharacterized protein TCM_006959 [Theobroma cacao]
MQHQNNTTRVTISKHLTRNDVEQSLLFPVPRIFNVQEGDLVYMHVRYNFGGTCKFPCCIKKYEETGSVLAIHWFEFVRLKGLRPNDEVILVAEFSSGKKTQMQLTMELKRKITLFGKDIWGHF